MYNKDDVVERVDTNRRGVVVAVLSPDTVSVHWHDGGGATDEHVADLAPVVQGPLRVAHTTDEFGHDRYFVEDGTGDWIGEPFDTAELAAQAILNIIIR